MTWLEINDDGLVVGASVGAAPAARDGYAAVERVDEEWIGWTRLPDGTFVPPGGPVDLYRYAAQRRKDLIEAGTVMVSGVPVPTDETTRNFLAGAAARIAGDPDYAIADWKIADGVYAPLPAATIIAIAHAVADKVQLMFSRNRAADEAIAAGTATTTAQVDAILEG